MDKKEKSSSNKKGINVLLKHFNKETFKTTNSNNEKIRIYTLKNYDDMQRAERVVRTLLNKIQNTPIDKRTIELLVAKELVLVREGNEYPTLASRSSTKVNKSEEL